MKTNYSLDARQALVFSSTDRDVLVQTAAALTNLVKQIVQQCSKRLLMYTFCIHRACTCALFLHASACKNCSVHALIASMLCMLQVPTADQHQFACPVHGCTRNKVRPGEARTTLATHLLADHFITVKSCAAVAERMAQHCTASGRCPFDPEHKPHAAGVCCKYASECMRAVRTVN